MLDIAYYPGCTLFEKAKELDRQAKNIANVFGYNLTEIPEWTCCGTVFPDTSKNISRLVGPYRMLANTASISDKLLTICSACFNVLKRTNKIVRENQEIREKLEGYTELTYNGDIEVIHYFEFLRDVVTYEKISEKIPVKRKLKVSPYYGCLLLRPHDELMFDDPENPTFLRDIITALGDESVEIPSQNECCGAYLLLNRQKEDLNLAKKIGLESQDFGSEILVTSCPSCYYALGKSGEANAVYFTEYMSGALGL